MSAPVIWIFLPIIFSLMLFFIRDYSNKQIIYVIFCLFILLLAIFFIPSPTDDPTHNLQIMRPELIVLGRIFTIDTRNKMLVILIYSLNILFGLAAYLYNVRTRILQFGLFFSSFLLSAVAIEPFFYAGLFIETAVIVAVIILGKGRTARSSIGISRFLAYLTLGLPFILLSGWYLAGGEISPVNNNQLILAAFLLGLGFLFWLSIFPFHSWVPMVLADTRTIDAGFIFILLQTTTIIILLKYINGFAWLRDFPIFFQAMRILGTMMAFLGAVWAFVERNIRKYIGYLFISSTGTLLLSIGLQSQISLTNYTQIAISRVLSLLLMVFSIAWIDIDQEKLHFDLLPGDDHRYLIYLIGFGISILSFSGFPLTIGFLPLLFQSQLLASNYPNILILSLITQLLIAFSSFRVFRKITFNMRHMNSIALIRKENIIVLLCIILIIVGGFFPQTIVGMFQSLIDGFEMLIQ